MDNAGIVLTTYVVTFGSLAAYVGFVIRRARRAARQVPVENRPWA
jgi:hypothetical protein